ncbi:hypothetical protein [Pseudomonas sp. NBRC 111128]|uniref:hypothetical protein n=1 Tax=Pseudomonas sp. NBRC 111128 TaxID=1661043 RepID=UPI000AFAAA06|nr:hypothetical protein [Pseudomonas sp. NBRC 111128]
MTIDKAKLKDLAQAVAELEDIPERQDEHAEAVAYLETHMHCHTILALLAEIERLESAKGDPVGSFDKHMEYMQENIRLKAENEDYRSGQDRYEQIIDDLKAENEALRKDAERYRAIRDDIPHVELGRAILDVQSADEYDAAVDAVMAKEASHG